MNDPRGEGPIEREDDNLLRLIRAGARKNEIALGQVDEESLAAYVMGTASPAQEARVRVALIGSAEFRRNLLELMEAASTPSTARERQAFERAVVPPMEGVSEMELPDSDPEQRTNTVRKTVHTTPGRHRWIEWALGGWAAAATATALALFMISRLPSPPGGVETNGSYRPSRPNGETPGTSATPNPNRYFALSIAEPLVLSGPSRGSAAKTIPVLKVDSLATAIQVKVDPPDVPDGSQVRVTLNSPDGDTVLDEKHAVEDFFGGRVLVLQSRQGFRSGRYVLTISGRRGSTRQEVSYPFMIEGHPAYQRPQAH